MHAAYTAAALAHKQATTTPGATPRELHLLNSNVQGTRNHTAQLRTRYRQAGTQAGTQADKDRSEALFSAAYASTDDTIATVPQCCPLDAASCRVCPVLHSKLHYDQHCFNHRQLVHTSSTQQWQSLIVATAVLPGAQQGWQERHDLEMHISVCRKVVETAIEREDARTHQRCQHRDPCV
jgi:hypothetical protein